MAVTVVNLYRSPYTVYAGRPGRNHPDAPFGNPYIVGKDGKKGECVELFCTWFHSLDDNAEKMRRHAITSIPPDAVLGCFCKPNPCHADIIAEHVNSYYEAKADIKDNIFSGNINEIIEQYLEKLYEVKDILLEYIDEISNSYGVTIEIQSKGE